MRAAPGFLTEREARFLALVVACAPAHGTVLEIGSFKGKSTVGLASVSQRYGLGPVVSVDPHSAPAVTDFGHGSAQSSWEDFRASLRTGPVRVFAEEILASDTFGPAGLCGSIGWAQYRPHDGARWRPARESLRKRVARLIPFVLGGREPTGLRKVRYKLWRGLVPHAAPDPAAWVRAVC